MLLRALFLRAVKPPFSLPRFELLHRPSHLFLVQWPQVNHHHRLRRPNLRLVRACALHPYVVARALHRQRGLQPLTLPPLVKVKFEVLLRPRAGPGEGLGGR